MGWGSGLQLLDTIWEDIKPYIDPSNYPEVAFNLMLEFGEMDCDQRHDSELFEEMRSNETFAENIIKADFSDDKYYDKDCIKEFLEEWFEDDTKKVNRVMKRLYK